MERRGAQRDRILSRLAEAEDGIGPDVIRRISQETGVPEAEIHGTARFYDLLVRPGPRICQGLTCQLQGSPDLRRSLQSSGWSFHAASCLGQCDRAPAAVDADLDLIDPRPGGGITQDSPELVVNLAGDEDLAYDALARTAALEPGAVIEQLKSSGLQGRGGAGFAAHVKWGAVRASAHASPHDPVVVCNADEAEPGTFKDRELMLRRPHLLLEGCAIAARCVGATEIYIYLRGEFPAPRRSVERALAAAVEPLRGLTFHLVSGHGAYICGEETALLSSLEGRRGMPRLKPPYPTARGLHGRPTLIHNVETLACVPAIVRRGGPWFSALGRTEPGLKLYCVSGHVKRPGVYELPLGVSLDEVVAAAGGYEGTPQAFCPGGASSGFLPMSERGRPLDFGGLAAAGTMLGSAGVVVLDRTVDIARAALWQLVFFERESCGQCAPCRIGTRVLRRALETYLQRGDASSLEAVADVAWEMTEGAICGLGTSAPLPLTSAMEYFPEAFTNRGG